MTSTLDGAALLRALAAHDVRYVIVGGFAVIAHGVIRTTEDLDICPDPEHGNLARLAALFTEIDAVQQGSGDFTADEMPRDPRRVDDLAAGGNFRLDTRHGTLDVMQWLSGIDADQAYGVLARDAITGVVGGIEVRVASLEHLRKMKRAAGRPQDLADLQALDAAHGGDAAHEGPDVPPPEPP